METGSPHKTVSLWNALLYPYRRKKGLFNILWVFVPIIGWLFITGYITRIVQSFCEGRFQKLPMSRFVDNVGTGFFIILKSLPFSISYALVIQALVLLFPSSTGIIIINTLILVLSVLAVQFLTIHFFYREKARAYFEWGIFRHVRNHCAEYLRAVIKTPLLVALFIIAHTIVAAPIIGALIVAAVNPVNMTVQSVFGVIIIGLITLSAIASISFTQNIFLAEFYRRRVLRK